MFEKSFSILKCGLVSLLVCSAGLFSCSKSVMTFDSVGDVVPGNIAFEVEAESVDTKVMVVNNRSLQTSGFKVSATTGSAGSETSAWNNISFSLDGGYYTGGKFWPTSNPSYHFYASNVALTHNAAGCTVSADNQTDVVCAYIANPYYQITNKLQFEHIFTRIDELEIVTTGDYSISHIRAYIYPKVSGTYNIRLGNGQTDGTGWSSVYIEPEPYNLMSLSDDLYLIPGSYDIEFIWNASKSGVTHSYTKTINVNLEKGKVNSISATLSGKDEPIRFRVSVAPWGNDPVDMGTIATPGTFAGLKLASGPLYYDGSSYRMYEDWNHSSYNSTYDKSEGSMLFQFSDMGRLFESSSFDNYSGDIDNNLNPFSGWRLPSKAEFEAIVGTTRTGSIVNGSAGKHYALIKLTGVNYAGTTTPNGLLLFPDGKTVSGKSLSGMDNTTQTTGVTLAELNNYLNQGCVFLPATGTRNPAGWSSGGITGYYFTSTESATASCYCFQFNASSLTISSGVLKVNGERGTALLVK